MSTQRWHNPDHAKQWKEEKARMEVLSCEWNAYVALVNSWDMKLRSGHYRNLAGNHFEIVECRGSHYREFRSEQQLRLRNDEWWQPVDKDFDWKTKSPKRIWDPWSRTLSHPMYTWYRVERTPTLQTMMGNMGDAQQLLSVAGDYKVAVDASSLPTPPASMQQAISLSPVNFAGPSIGELPYQQGQEYDHQQQQQPCQKEQEEIPVDPSLVQGIEPMEPYNGPPLEAQPVEFDEALERELNVPLPDDEQHDWSNMFADADADFKALDAQWQAQFGAQPISEDPIDYDLEL